MRAAVILAIAMCLMGASKPRSTKWPAFEKRWLADNPRCAFRGCVAKKLEVHHIKAFNTNPELELDPTNVITLCRYHHIAVGHRGNTKDINPNVRQDCERGIVPAKAIERMAKRRDKASKRVLAN